MFQKRLFLFSFCFFQFVGPFADSYKELFGDYSPDPNPQFTKTPRQGLKKLAAKNSYAAGCDSPKCKTYHERDVAFAIDGADMAVVCLGTGKSPFDLFAFVQGGQCLKHVSLWHEFERCKATTCIVSLVVTFGNSTGTYR